MNKYSKTLKSALIASAAILATSGTANACLDVNLVPWPTPGWTIDPQDYCIRGRGDSNELRTVQSGARVIFEAEITLENNRGSLAASRGGLVFRSSGSHLNGYLAQLHKSSDRSTVELFIDGVRLARSVNRAIDFDTAYKLRVEADGPQISVYFNDEAAPAISVSDDTYSTGNLGLYQGGEASFNNIRHLADYRPSLHTSEIGYQAEGSKKAILRGDALDPTNYSGNQWQLINTGTRAVVASGTLGNVVTKWGVPWYEIDFSNVNTAGSYRLTVRTSSTSTVNSSTFTIGDRPLLDQQMYQIAVNQLEQRYGIPRTNVGPRIRGGFVPPPGTDADDVKLSNHPNYPFVHDPDIVQIWGDAAGNYAEIVAVGITTHALIDLLENPDNGFTPAQLTALRTNIQRGASYIVSAQEEHADDPMRDGHFRHSVSINLHDHAYWAGNVKNWNGLAYSIGVLARAYNALAQTHPTEAASYLAAAKKAWTLGELRPYYLSSELGTSSIPNYDNTLGGRSPVLWTWDDWKAEARGMYVIRDSSWDFGTVLQQTENYQGLRTRELLSFLWASTLMYQITDETGADREKYLTEAKAVANEIAARQYTDHQNPLDGVYGMFHEFSQSDTHTADDDAFLKETAQTGMNHLGNYQYTTLQGFIDLLEFAPTDSDAAKWHRVISLWANDYMKPASNANPFKVAPSTVIKHTSPSGPASVYWFGNRLHGGSDTFGQAAKSLLQVGNYLDDKDMHDLAVANLQWYAGVNPGIDAPSRRFSNSSLIRGVGARSVALYIDPFVPVGAVANGYNSLQNFNRLFYTFLDAPGQVVPPDFPGNVTNGQETWIAHSHAYVMGVANAEAPYTLKIHTEDGSTNVVTSIDVREVGATTSSGSYTTNATTGDVTITDLGLNKDYVVTLTRENEHDITFNVAALGGGEKSFSVDYDDAVYGALTALSNPLAKSTPYKLNLTLSNHGHTNATVAYNFSADGGTLSATSGNRTVSSRPSTNASGPGTSIVPVTFTTGSEAGPAVVRAHIQSGDNSHTVVVESVIQ